MPPQIFRPKVGRRYTVHTGEHEFVGLVTAWDEETVTVRPPHEFALARRWPEFLRLKRIATTFGELP